MGLKSKLMELLGSMPDDEDDTPGEPDTAAVDPGENPEPTGQGEDPTSETPSELNPDPTAGNDAPDGAAEDGTPEEPPTLADPVSPMSDEDRDVANNLAVENEALRNENSMLRERIAELGGDTALGITGGIADEVVEPAPGDEPDDEYDPEADLAAQEAELRRLRGDTDGENE